MRHRVPLVLALPTLLALAVLAAARAAPGQRIVLASVTVDGEVVLRGSTADDGSADADAVWGYLVDRIELEPTPAFAALGVEPGAEALSLGWLKRRDDERGEPPALGLEIAYGGRDAPHRLGLVRAGARWRVDRETVERRFAHRWIRRAEAAALDEPRRKR